MGVRSRKSQRGLDQATIDPTAKPVLAGGMLLESPCNLGIYASTEVLSKRREIVRRKGSEFPQSGDFRGSFKRGQKSEPCACVSSIEITSNGRTTDIDLQYRDFGHYVIYRLEVQEEEYNTGQEEALNRLMQM